jgi:hypothetical protein
MPGKLLAAGYPFRFPELEEALRHELGPELQRRKMRGKNDRYTGE